MVTIPILYQDHELVIVDKPPGLVVNRAETVKGPTLQDWVEIQHLIGQQPAESTTENDFYKRSGIVHRLDKDTSGALLVAKSSLVFDQLQLLFAKRQVQKKYLALVHGLPPARDGQVAVPVGRLPWNRQRFGVVVGGKEALTHYRLLQTYVEAGSEAKYSLLELTPATGRTHQIRVHLKYLGLPIVADHFYLGKRELGHDKRWCPRVFLHASLLSFSHPKTGKTITVTVPLPPDLTRALAHLTP